MTAHEAVYLHGELIRCWLGWELRYEKSGRIMQASSQVKQSLSTGRVSSGRWMQIWPNPSISCSRNGWMKEKSERNGLFRILLVSLCQVNRNVFRRSRLFWWNCWMHRLSVLGRAGISAFENGLTKLENGAKEMGMRLPELLRMLRLWIVKLFHSNCIKVKNGWENWVMHRNMHEYGSEECK